MSSPRHRALEAPTVLPPSAPAQSEAPIVPDSSEGLEEGGPVHRQTQKNKTGIGRVMQSGPFRPGPTTPPSPEKGEE